MAKHSRRLVDRIRRDLKPIEARILAHPYLDALEARQVSQEALRTFAGQQHHIITSDLRSLAQLVSRHGHLPSRDFLKGMLDGELAALAALETFAHALSLSERELAAFEPIPAGHAYCAYIAQLCLYGSDAELAAAFLVNFAAWGANCGRMGQALRSQYGFAGDDVAFFDLFANVPPFDADAEAVIEAALERGVPSRDIHRAARMLQGYELLFWDAMAAAADLPPPARS